LDEQYTDQLTKLLPPGRAFTRALGSTLRALLAGIAREIARVHRRALMLKDETDPRFTSELLADWERFLGLPSECAPSDLSSVERRDAVVTKYTEKGGQSRQFFIDLAASYGYNVTITEYREAKAGIARAGDAISNGPWVHRWDINAPAVTVTSRLRAGGSTGDALRIFSRETSFACEIRRRKPAHTIVEFIFS
jgi:uncharacterized protein YmfQ (DUF2313 family)